MKIKKILLLFFLFAFYFQQSNGQGNAQIALTRDVYFVQAHSTNNLMMPFLNDTISNFPTSFLLFPSPNSTFVSLKSTITSIIDTVIYIPSANFTGVDTLHYAVFDNAASKYDTQTIYAFVGVSFCGYLQHFHQNILSENVQNNILTITDNYQNYFGYYDSTNNLGYYSSNYFLASNFLLDSNNNPISYFNYTQIPPAFTYSNVLSIKPGNYQFDNIVTIQLFNFQAASDTLVCNDTISFPVIVGLPSNKCMKDSFVFNINSVNDTLDVLKNDTPNYNAAITLVFAQPKHGSLVLGANGKLIYTPTYNFLGVDSFTYTSCYNSGGNNYCDSAKVKIKVKCGLSIISNWTVFSCRETPYYFFNQQIMQAGIYRDTFKTLAGCDSIIVLNFQYTAQRDSLITQIICQGQTYMFNGQSYGSTGLYSDTFQGLSGCDSIISLNLTVLHKSDSIIYQTFCGVGSSYMMHGRTYNLTGVYFDTTQNHLGCDSALELHLTIIPNTNYSFNYSICNGNYLWFYGKKLFNSGTFVDTLLNYLGCDSFVTVHLTNLQPVYDTFNDIICSGTNYYFNNHLITQAGMYTDTINSYTGCDSIVTANLTLHYPSSLNIFDTICSNQFYTFNGRQLNSSGNFYDTLTNAQGCDSLIILHLQINFYNRKTIFKNICANQTYFFGGNNLNSSGTFYDTLQNRFGCDSMITLFLNIDALPIKTVSKNICVGNTFTIKGKTYSLAGVYNIDTLPNVGVGCDTVLKLHLIITAPDTSISKQGDSLISNSQNASFTWINCNNGMIIQQANGKVFVPNISGNYAVIVNTLDCVDTSRCYFVSVPTGIANTASVNDLRLYPNPADDYLMIENNGLQISSIKIFDLNGRLILSKQLDENNANTKIDVSHFQNGMYEIELMNNRHQSIFQKLSILHP